MANTTHLAYTQTATSILNGTELNSLATATNSVVSATIDNTTNLDLYMDLELILAVQGVGRSASATVAVYATWSLDGGTNYDDALDTVSQLIATFPLDAATTARRVLGPGRDIPIPPGIFKIFARNNTGQAFAASGSSFRYRTHSIKTV